MTRIVLDGKVSIVLQRECPIRLSTNRVRRLRGRPPPSRSSLRRRQNSEKQNEEFLLKQFLIIRQNNFFLLHSKM